MPGPVIGSCGGVGERPCPPITCIVTETEAAVHAYGSDCFEAGKTARDAEVSDLKTQLAALSDNDLSASQQLMVERTKVQNVMLALQASTDDRGLEGQFTAWLEINRERFHKMTIEDIARGAAWWAWQASNSNTVAMVVAAIQKAS